MGVSTLSGVVIRCGIVVVFSKVGSLVPTGVCAETVVARQASQGEDRERLRIHGASPPLFKFSVFKGLQDAGFEMQAEPESL